MLYTGVWVPIPGHRCCRHVHINACSEWLSEEVGVCAIAWGTIDKLPLTLHLHLAELARILVRAALSVRCLEFCSTLSVQ